MCVCVCMREKEGGRVEMQQIKTKHTLTRGAVEGDKLNSRHLTVWTSHSAGGRCLGRERTQCCCGWRVGRREW